MFNITKIYVLLLWFCLLSPQAQAQEKEKEIIETDYKSLALTEKKIVTITEKGLSPEVTVLDQADSSLFFFNNLKDTDINLEIDFKEKTLHCASSNLENFSGMLKTTKPIKFGDFALVCFPDRGVYNFKVSRPNLTEILGTVKVEY